MEESAGYLRKVESDRKDFKMKSCTFTVLVIEEYDEANGVVMTDAEAVKEMRDAFQAAYDDGPGMGTNFLIVKVEDGDEGFWDKWTEAVRLEQAENSNV